MKQLQYSAPRNTKGGRIKLRGPGDLTPDIRAPLTVVPFDAAVPTESFIPLVQLN